MLRTAEEIVNSAWNAGLKPPPVEKVWEWADLNRTMPPGSPNPGAYRTDRTPFWRGVMDCLSSTHPCRICSLCKGVQVGGTEIGINFTGQVIDAGLGNELIVLPTEGVAKEWSELRLSHLIETTPSLVGKIRLSKERDSGNRKLMKKFNGGFLKFAWATSSKVLRSTPAAYIVGDEVDDWEGDVEGEGDPDSLCENRMSNFPRGKFFRLSSIKPGRKSRIHRDFLSADQRYFFVPCPHCGHFQRLKWSGKNADGDSFGIRWTEGKPETAHYVCVSCVKQIPERYKTQMLSRGDWVATDILPEKIDTGFTPEEWAELTWVRNRMAEARHASFHLSSLYSPLGWYSWQSTVEQWVAAQKDPLKLKTFITTRLAEVWEEKDEKVEWETLYERRGKVVAGKIPKGFPLLTAGVDVQNNRLEIEVVAWGPGLRSCSIWYEVLYGNTQEDKVWAELQEFLNRTWEYEGGGHISVMVMGIDTGYAAEKIYKFAGANIRAVHSHIGTKIRRPRTVVPTKGGHSSLSLIEHISNENAAAKRKGLKIVTIGTHYAKSEFYSWLKGKPAQVGDGLIYPSGYCEFPDYESAYFQGIVSETRIVSGSTGKIEYVNDSGVRNEPLDTRIIARGMAALCGADQWTERHWQYREASVTTTIDIAPVRQLETVAVVPEVASVERDRPATVSTQRPGGWLRGRGRNWL